MLVPSAEVSDRRSPRLEGPAMLDGTVGGEGRGGGTGDPGSLVDNPAPMGDGSAGAREDVGELCTGREGSDGPALSGECCRSDVDGEWTDGEPEDMVPDLNAFIGVSAGRRMGIGLGESERPIPRLSLRSRMRIARADGVNSSLEPTDGVPCRMDEWSDTPEADAAFVPAPDKARVIGNATFCDRGLLPVRDVVRVCVRGGRMNRSGTDDGGERGSDVRMGTLPGELVSESRCWFRSSVGVNSGSSSCERNREDNKDSRSKILNSGVVRYVVERKSVPLGWITDGKLCT